MPAAPALPGRETVRADWYTESLPISFGDPDVLAQDPDGVPAEGATYISGQQAITLTDRSQVDPTRTEHRMQQERPIRIGLVGFGVGGASSTLRTSKPLRASSLSGVVARSPERRAVVAQRYPGVPVYDSLPDLAAAQEAGAGSDAVTITTPPQTRRDLVREALGRGLHVVADKPFAPNAAAGVELDEAGRRSGHVLSGLPQPPLGLRCPYAAEAGPTGESRPGAVVPLTLDLLDEPSGLGGRTYQLAVSPTRSAPAPRSPSPSTTRSATPS